MSKKDELDIKGWVAFVLTAGAVLVGIVLWAANSLAGKAPVETVGRVQQLEARMSKVEAYETYTMGGVYEVAKHVGVVIPPPPAP